MLLLSAMFSLSACGLDQPPITTVIVPSIIKETQIVETTRIVEATRIVKEILVTTVEVTRLVQEAIPVTPAPPPPSERTVEVTQGAALMLPRAQHTATVLYDGRVLLVGGISDTNQLVAETEIYDPATGITIQAAPLHTPRYGHTATLLYDGRVLVTGGRKLIEQWLDDAEVYDPYANAWTVMPMISAHGIYHTATLMSDGRVLIVGGAVEDDQFTDRVEIFNPQTDTWNGAMTLVSDRATHTAQLLSDGRVLVIGGANTTGVQAGGDALIYDPQTNIWTAISPMVKPRLFAESVELSNSWVLVAGGINLEDMFQGVQNQRVSTSTEIYDPVLDTWTAMGALTQPRYDQFMTKLPDGRVLAVGGMRDWECCWTIDSFLRGIEIYDPAIGVWYPVGELPQPAVYTAGVFLPDGRVWLTGGGISDDNKFIFSPNTWFITPGYGQP